ncbi:MAG: TonB-dependent receptor [Chitinophagaceae bacterium]|nr:TonB-dependent receptor [Chitinophagaceae bacterium]MBP7107389.1 TonB-dependent receptor [Chitinophagaceae bacterium]MBP7314710.1 TonB-dependent receptor [Chitinophagaceae bacterium]
MKLTIAFMLFAVLNVSAKGWSQDRITLKINGAEIKKVLFTIEKKSSFRFLFNEDVLKGKSKVTLDVEDASLAEVLDKLLSNTGVGYKIMSSNLVVLKESTSEAEIEVQEVRVSGSVITASGEPLSGVSVTIKGTATGTTTDASGNYSITVPDNATLVFSYVGFNNIEERVEGRTSINVVLQTATNSLEEVVVVGYGTQKKKDLTGSVSSIKGEEVAKMPGTNPISSLQGKVPGLTISNSGRAGSSPVVRIRGVNSTNSASPVYVVDGILHDNIDFLNPADIESIDILRDPSSIAIYGLRGANGVIAITSKKAVRGKTTVSLQSSVGIQTVQNKIELADADGFKKLLDAQLINQGAGAFDFSRYTANTDWQDLIFRDAVITSNNISVSNSGEKSTTYLNLGYTNQEGVLKNDQYERFLIRLNQEIRINKNIKVGGDITGYHYKNNPPGVSITNALWAAPVVPIQFDENTYYSMISLQRAQVGNPIATLNRNDGNSVERGYRVVGNIFAEVKFLKSFTWRSAVYGDFNFNTGRSYGQLPFSVYDLGEGITPDNIRFDDQATTSVSQDQSESRRFQQDHTLTFDKRLGKGHSINAVAGITTIYSTSSFVNGRRIDTLINIPDDPDYWYLGVTNPNNPQTNGGGGAEGSIVGTFARVGYSYLGKYLLNATIRRDGSSKFAPENRWGTFGSVGAGWIISDENFFTKVKGIDFLKLRAAWGLTGNANGFAENLWRPGIQNSNSAIFGNNIYPAIQAAYIVDSSLHWETVQGIDVGIDLRALKNKLNVEVTFYNRTTTDILTSVEIPNDSRRKFTNLGKIANKGIEVSAGWSDNIGKNFTYSVSGNYSYNKNVVNAIGDKFNFEISGNGGVNLTRTGQSIGYFYGYTQTGIYQSTADLAKQPAFSDGSSLPGDISYADINGDGVINSDDRGYLGSPFPEHNFGASIALGYKGVDFSIEGQGATGHKIYTERRKANFAVLNWEANRLDAWTAPGTSNIEPIVNNNRGNNYLFSSYYLEPGDYFRIRSLQIGYTFSPSLLKKAGIQKARIFLNGQNVKTWSKVTGYSPEPLIGSILGGGADNGSYPVPSIYSLGLNLTF